MPGTFPEWHKLHSLTVTANQYMCRHFGSADFFEIGMAIPVELVGEQLLDFRTTEFTGWQTDAMQDNQVDLRASGPLVLIRTGALSRRLDESAVRINGMGANGQSLLYLR